MWVEILSLGEIIDISIENNLKTCEHVTKRLEFS